MVSARKNKETHLSWSHSKSERTRTHFNDAFFINLTQVLDINVFSCFKAIKKGIETSESIIRTVECTFRDDGIVCVIPPNHFPVEDTASYGPEYKEPNEWLQIWLNCKRSEIAFVRVESTVYIWTMRPS